MGGTIIITLVLLFIGEKLVEKDSLISIILGGLSSVIGALMTMVLFGMGAVFILSLL